MFSSYRVVLRTTAVSLTLALFFSACGGHGSGTSGLLPQTGAKHFMQRSIAFSRERLQKFGDFDSRAGLKSAVVGSQQPATADPPVPRPNTTPCIVQLFTNQAFADFSPKPFAYAPPAACPGPWQKVVLDADFNVTAGRQFDRTGSIWIGGTNVYFGTTAEPRATLSPSWHVERDVTDLSAVLASASSGETVLGNLVNSTFTGIITGSSRLEFYPARHRDDAPRVADVVYSLANGPNGDNFFLNNSTSLLAGTFSFPRNVEKAYLDVYLQSQANDEFWYTCVPDNLASELQSCGSTAFREGQVTIDGQIAGVAPVYPWIYTGGIDPLLWRPIPGVETFEFVPYRVNLTPFAGILNDGNQHTVAVSVFNANVGFSANAALELFLDRGSSNDSGGLLANATATSPSVSVTNGITTDSSGNITGPVNTAAWHPVQVSGFVNTSHGRVETTVSQSISFSNVDTFGITNTAFNQNIKQLTTLTSHVRVQGGGPTQFFNQTRQWPLNLAFSFVVNTDGSGSQTTTVHQAKNETRRRNGGGERLFSSTLSNTVDSTDTLLFDSNFNITGNTGAKSSQHYIYNNNEGVNYNKTVTSANNVVTGVF